MRILLSNDDSVHGLGIKKLFIALSQIADVTVVAPLEEKSTTGHSLTLHKPLRVLEIEKNFYGVSGSPADCVHMGLSQIMKNKKPNLILSGINRGANLGQDVFYSGTVSAAREGCIQGLPAVAVSLAIDFKSRKKETQLHYDSAVHYTCELVQRIRKKEIILPQHSLLNLNIPDLPVSKIRGLRVVRQGFRHYNGNIIKRTDHRGKPYYWVGGEYRGFHKIKDTDCMIVDEGYASLTPLRLDCTDHEYLNLLSETLERKQKK